MRARPRTRTRDADGRSEATPASKTGVIYSKSSRVAQSPENGILFFLPLPFFGAFPRGARAAPTGAQPDGRPETDFFRPPLPFLSVSFS